MKTRSTIILFFKNWIRIWSFTINGIINCLITDNDNNDKVNYINIKSKNLVINIHKNDKNWPKIIELDDTFLNYIKPGLDKYLISNKKKGII